VGTPSLGIRGGERCSRCACETFIARRLRYLHRVHSEMHEHANISREQSANPSHAQFWFWRDRTRCESRTRHEGVEAIQLVSTLETTPTSASRAVPRVQSSGRFFNPFLGQIEYFRQKVGMTNQRNSLESCGPRHHLTICTPAQTKSLQHTNNTCNVLSS
jgi:hypothetical protein